MSTPEAPKGEARARAIAELGRLLAERAVDGRSVVDTVALRTTELVGDACIVWLLSADGEQLEPVALRGPPGERTAALEEALRHPRPLRNSYSERVVATGRGIRLAHIGPEELAHADPTMRAVTERFGIETGCIVPLRAAGRVIGALAVGRFAPAPAYDEDDEEFLQEIADRAGLAIANARLIEELRRARDDLEQRVRERTEELARKSEALEAEIAFRRRVEEQVRAQERFLESIVENIPDMIFVKDARELRFVRFNRAGEELLGYSRDDLLGKNDYDFFPPEEAEFFTRKDREVLARGAVVDIPSEPIHTRHKGLRHLHTKKIPILDAEGRPEYLLGISEDITERKRAEDALARRTEELARSNADLEQFAYVASHDLQEPLRKIRSFGEVLAEEAGASLAPEARHHLERIQNAATRMQALIDDLLTLSRVTTQASPFVRVDLGAIAREVISDLEVSITEKRARVDLEPLPSIDADPVQMRQLLQNLVSNALKFHAGSTPPEVRIHARVAQDRSDGGDEGDGAGATCDLVVEDHGIGFDPKHAERIFKPFQRLHARDAYQGTGIGLAICKRIAERHGGRIAVTSDPGKGSTFTVTLPLRQPPYRRTP